MSPDVTHALLFYLIAAHCLVTLWLIRDQRRLRRELDLEVEQRRSAGESWVHSE